MSFKRRRCDNEPLAIIIDIHNNSKPAQIIENDGKSKPATNVNGPENQKMTYNIDPGGTAPNLEQDPLPVIPGLISAREAIPAEKYLTAEHFHKMVSFAYISIKALRIIRYYNMFSRAMNHYHSMHFYRIWKMLTYPR